MFSVIIPYYKKFKYIERCVDAVLAQSFRDFEIILVDDGSEDHLQTLVQDKYLDRIILITQPNQGVSAARNAGISKATHDFIAFLDADDYWSPFYLEKVAEVIEREENIKIIGSKYSRKKDEIETVPQNLEYITIRNYFKNALRNAYFFTSGTVLAREFFEKQSGFNPVLKSGEDMDVWFRAILSGGNAYYIKNTLVYYSDEDENQATATPKNLQNRFVYNAYFIYFQNGNKVYSEEFYKFLSKYMYSSLYIIYFQSATQPQAKEILSKISEKYFLADIYYKTPFVLGNRLLRNSKIRKGLRKYFKFIFTYIHN